MGRAPQARPEATRARVATGPGLWALSGHREPGQDHVRHGTRRSWRMSARALGASARARILGWYVLLLAVALAVSIVTVHQVLVSHINNRIDAELAESASELSALTRSTVVPGSDEALTSVAQLVSLGVRSGVAEQNATLI